MPNRKKGRPNWSPLLLTERSKFSTPIAKMLMGDAASCARSIRLHVDVIGVARDVTGAERTGSATDQSRHFGRGPASSGFPLWTDIVRAGRHVSNVPWTDIERPIRSPRRRSPAALAARCADEQKSADTALLIGVLAKIGFSPKYRGRMNLPIAWSKQLT